MSKILSGRRAIEIARVYGIPLHRYPGQTEPARENLTLEEAMLVAEHDEHLIWTLVPRQRIRTASGSYRVYHKEEAFEPTNFEGGPWFFEPADYSDSEAYSLGYATEMAALDAAEAWEAKRRSA